MRFSEIKAIIRALKAAKDGDELPPEFKELEQENPGALDRLCERMDKPETRFVDNLEDVDYSGLKLTMFVLYDHPSDFPDKIVVRVWDALNGPTNIACLFDTLDAAREAMPQHFTCLPRANTDDPVIIESWV